MALRDDAKHVTLMRNRDTFGECPSAFDAWLLLRSLRTLELRVLHQSRSALTIANWLEVYGLTVYYPFLSSAPDREIAQSQMEAGGALLSFELPTASQAQKLSSRLHLFSDATSLGGYRSLLEWRRKHDSDISDRLLRISVGLEHVDDLLADLDQGLRSIGVIPSERKKT